MVQTKAGIVIRFSRERSVTCAIEFLDKGNHNVHPLSLELMQYNPINPMYVSLSLSLNSRSVSSYATAYFTGFDTQRV